ncbi:hypothetical protein EUX98_g9125 [Antrodiella citrinella]|uniref:Uncharacterized protein n=1 Tax=Antrodiella citrinella TaxID=2447956 RepID=A0A4S4M034_9APHY|nr:hypothetical protein EUX98_g9125 [Antrodiella citrinella]
MSSNLAAINFSNDLLRRREDIHCALDTIANDFTVQQRALITVHNTHIHNFLPLLQSHIALVHARRNYLLHRGTIARHRCLIEPLRNTLRDTLLALDNMEVEQRQIERELEEMRIEGNRAMYRIVDGFLDMDRAQGLEFFPRADNDFDPFSVPYPVPPPYQPRTPSPPLAAPIPIPPRGFIRDSISGSLVQIPIDPYDEPGPVMPLYTLQHPEPSRRSSSELSYRTVPEEPKDEEIDQLLPSSPSNEPIPIPYRLNLTPGPSFISRSPTTAAHSSPRLSRTRRLQAATRRAIDLATRRSPVLTRRRSNS